MATWARESEFKRLLTSQIKRMTKEGLETLVYIAMKDMNECYKAVPAMALHYMKKISKEGPGRLHVLRVLDAIIGKSWHKNRVEDKFVSRIENAKIAPEFFKCMSECSEDNRRKAVKILEMWRKHHVLSPPALAAAEDALGCEFASHAGSPAARAAASNVTCSTGTKATDAEGEKEFPGSTVADNGRKTSNNGSAYASPPEATAHTPQPPKQDASNVSLTGVDASNPSVYHHPTPMMGTNLAPELCSQTSREVPPLPPEDDNPPGGGMGTGMMHPASTAQPPLENPPLPPGPAPMPNHTPGSYNFQAPGSAYLQNSNPPIVPSQQQGLSFPGSTPLLTPSHPHNYSPAVPPGIPSHPQAAPPGLGVPQHRSTPGRAFEPPKTSTQSGPSMSLPLPRVLSAQSPSMHPPGCAPSPAISLPEQHHPGPPGVMQPEPEAPKTGAPNPSSHASIEVKPPPSFGEVWVPSAGEVQAATSRSLNQVRPPESAPTTSSSMPLTQQMQPPTVPGPPVPGPPAPGPPASPMHPWQKAHNPASIGLQPQILPAQMHPPPNAYLAGRPGPQHGVPGSGFHPPVPPYPGAPGVNMDPHGVGISVPNPSAPYNPFAVPARPSRPPPNQHPSFSIGHHAAPYQPHAPGISMPPTRPALPAPLQFRAPPRPDGVYQTPEAPNLPVPKMAASKPPDSIQGGQNPGSPTAAEPSEEEPSALPGPPPVRSQPEPPAIQSGDQSEDDDLPGPPERPPGTLPMATPTDADASTVVNRGAPVLSTDPDPGSTVENTSNFVLPEPPMPPDKRETANVDDQGSHDAEAKPLIETEEVQGAGRKRRRSRWDEGAD